MVAPVVPDVADATNGIVAGAVNVAPLAGEVMVTVGVLNTASVPFLIAENAELPALLKANILYLYVVPERVVVSV
jgi:hypothetical protein